MQTRPEATERLKPGPFLPHSLFPNCAHARTIQPGVRIGVIRDIFPEQAWNETTREEMITRFVLLARSDRHALTWSLFKNAEADFLAKAAKSTKAGWEHDTFIPFVPFARYNRQKVTTVLVKLVWRGVYFWSDGASNEREAEWSGTGEDEVEPLGQRMRMSLGGLASGKPKKQPGADSEA